MQSKYHFTRTGGFPAWNEMSGMFDTEGNASFGFVGQGSGSVMYYFGGYDPNIIGINDYIDGEGNHGHAEWPVSEIDLSSYDGQRDLQNFFDSCRSYIVTTEHKLSANAYDTMVQGIKLYASEKGTKIYVGAVTNFMSFGDQGLEVKIMSGTVKLKDVGSHFGQSVIGQTVDNIFINAYAHDYVYIQDWNDSHYEFFAHSLLSKAIEDEYITDPEIIDFFNENPWDEIHETRGDWTVNVDGVKNPDITIMWSAPMIESGDLDGDNATVNMSILRQEGATFHEETLGTFPYNKHVYKTSWKKLAEQANLFILDKILANIFDFYESWVDVYMYITYYHEGSVATTSKVHARIDYKGQTEGYVLQPRDGSTITFTHTSTDEAIEDFLDDIDMDDLDDPTVTDPTLDQAFSGVGLLTKTYVLSKSRLQQIGAFLWSRDFFDFIQDLNASPIENIVSVKMVPFEIPAGNDTEIILGNVATGVLGKPVDINYNCKHNIGTVTIRKKYPADCNFLNSNTFTKLSIFLPFIGFKELDADIFLDHRLRVEYINDIITGNCKAVIYADDIPICDFSGQIGLDVPISSTNRAQVEAGLIAGIGQTVGSIVSGDIGGAVSSALSIASNGFHTESRGANSPSCDSFMTHDCFYILENAIVQYPSRYNHTHGRPLNLTKTLRNVSGFTVCEDVDVSGIQGATKEELDFIKDKLESGVYL